MTKRPKAPKKAKADTTASEPKPSKASQLKIPGTERKRIAKIDEAAEAYRIQRNKRQEETKKEKAKKQELMAVAREHGVQVYVYEAEDGEEFTVEYTSEAKENVKVTKVPDGEDDE